MSPSVVVMSMVVMVGSGRGTSASWPSEASTSFSAIFSVVDGDVSEWRLDWYSKNKNPSAVGNSHALHTQIFQAVLVYPCCHVGTGAKRDEVY